ncbi:MAG TPA: tetratricopeptide repeat protein [Ideonella sp.]|jgi:Tfp pilus assembly protein PilF|nr:tetratricopeptide repeat protein [Ideonella sp.]
MNAASTPDPLAQLEGFLAQDPTNDGLRAEAFAAALRLGRRERADAHLRAGLASGSDALGWRLRQAHWLMAQHDWPAAQASLSALLQAQDAPSALINAVRQDLALVALRSGRVDEGLACLAPLVDAAGLALDPNAQALYLRLLHHAGRLDELLLAAQRWADTGRLGADATGVASLAALDAGQLGLCQAWAQAALAQLPQQMEALVASASLALGRQAAADAKALLRVALQVNPQDGRAWSAWAFAEMLAGELAAARSSFERALQFMPEHIGTWHGLGWAALFLGDLDAAQSAFQQALALDRNFAESHGGLAVVHARRGDRAAADAATEIALRLDRHCMSAHYARAVLEGRADDAAELQRLASQLLIARRQREGA